MLRKLARDTLIYGAATLISRGIQIVLIPLYTRVLAPAEYGVMELVAVLGALVNLTVALEISQGVARYLAEADSLEDKRSYASTAVLFSSAAYGLFALAAWWFALPLTRLMFVSDEWSDAVRIAIAAIALNGVFALLQDLLRWRLRPLSYLAASLAFTVTSAGLGVYLVMLAGAGVAGVLWAQVAGGVAGAVVARLQLGDLVRLVFDRQRLRRMLAYSVPLVLSSGAVFANLFIDRLAVKELLGISELGVYGVSARFASLVSLATLGLQAALTPLVFQNYRDPATAVALGRAFRYFCIAMVPVVGALALFAAELLQVLTGAAFHAGRTVLPVLAAGAFFANLYIFAPGLFLGGRTGAVAGINISAAALNLGLNLLLVPMLGMIGAALAATVAAGAAFTGFVMLGHRLYAIPYDWRRSGVAIGVGCVLIAVAVWLNAPPPRIDLGGIALKIVLLAAGASVTLIAGLERNEHGRLLSWIRKRRAASRGGRS